jgi:hypothetical protein
MLGLGGAFVACSYAAYDFVASGQVRVHARLHDMYAIPPLLYMLLRGVGMRSLEGGVTYAR